MNEQNELARSQQIHHNSKKLHLHSQRSYELEIKSTLGLLLVYLFGPGLWSSGAGEVVYSPTSMKAKRWKTKSNGQEIIHLLTETH